jgi:hypothetical protein
MSYRLEPFSDVGLDEAKLELVIGEHERSVAPRFERLWTYYRNPLRPVGVGAALGTREGPGRWYSLAQEVGLPRRLTERGVGSGPLPEDAPKREVVVENDIAWRVQTMVDFIFGKPVLIDSTARDPALRARIARVLDHVWQASGGIALLQDFATLGHVFGHVDLLLRGDAANLATLGGLLGETPSDDELLLAAEKLRIELVEPRRGAPLLDERDYRRIRAYVVRASVPDRSSRGALAWLDGVKRWIGAGPRGAKRDIVEIVSGSAWQVYAGSSLVFEQGALCGGAVPVVHVQNTSQPFEYEGLGEVEPLIPLQDELNTRLSDRANRVTMQSFKMYLAKGVEGFDRVGVGPGQLWYTDNLGASIEAFGGDASSPSEEEHVREVREAMDKISSVPPVAGGVVQARIGNLSSANALRITLLGLLAKTQRKRIAYGGGIERMCGLVLAALDQAGILRTSEGDRGVRLRWPEPLPDDPDEMVRVAKLKRELGVSREQVLAELGYGGADAGVA